MLDNKLLEIIKLKNFKNIWVMLEYLTDIGCSDDEIIEILPKFYLESNYFEDVAYGKIIGLVNEENNISYTGKSTVQWVLFIGMIDDSNRKLSGMFNVYKSAMATNKIRVEESNAIENLCKEKYEFTNLSDKTIDYFRNISIKYYGYALL
tara:strand:+ start:2136 stop:2585 length:450 start_codon:yes stop_codon:yes gene_type:complete